MLRCQMKIRLHFALLMVLIMAGCSVSLPKGMKEAKILLDTAVMSGDDRLVPEEFASASDAYRTGSELLVQGKDREAEEAFLLAWQKGEMLAADAAAKRKRLEEQAAQEAARQQELERQRAIEEKARVAEEREREEAKKRAEKAKQKDKPLPAYHTVKRGESLPTIALSPSVYSDSGLWPLIYRANRDQIKDPRAISAGQILRIPRNLSRDDIAEARKYAQDHPL